MQKQGEMLAQSFATKLPQLRVSSGERNAANKTLSTRSGSWGWRLSRRCVNRVISTEAVCAYLLARNQTTIPYKVTIAARVNQW